MRRTIVAAVSAALGALLAVPAAAQEAAQTHAECTIQFRGSDFMLQALGAHLEPFPGYFPLCERLRERGFGISVLDGHGLVGEAKFGMAMIRLFDQRTGAEGARYATNSLFSQAPADDVEAYLLAHTIMIVLDDIAGEMESYVASVDSENDRLRTFFGGGA